MVGGEKESVGHLRPVFQTLAPHPDKGWGHVGPTGSGHFVKMVHNGIEYGLMQAYAEGFEDMLHRMPDVSKLQQAIGFVPATPLEVTLHDVITWIQSQPDMER